MFRRIVFALTLSVLTYAASAYAHKPEFEVRIRTCDLDKAVAAGNYDWVHSHVKKSNAPKASCKEDSTVEIDLFRFDAEAVSTDEVLEAMKKVHCRPATWPELFALGAQEQWLQTQERVVGLGSQWTTTTTPTYPALDRTETERTVALYSDMLGWIKDRWAFAAVCEHEEKK